MSGKVTSIVWRMNRILNKDDGVALAMGLAILGIIIVIFCLIVVGIVFLFIVHPLVGFGSLFAFFITVIYICYKTSDVD